ncbi:MAG TPA: hypothetical protein V6D15_19665 [Oculatellaceae cyanobacterium]|jgi:hypothetical protein
MMQNLDQMTTAELKQYLSEHRNDEEAFRIGLQTLMNRRDPNTPRQPYPFDLDDPEAEVEAILREKLNQSG